MAMLKDIGKIRQLLIPLLRVGAGRGRLLKAFQQHRIRPSKAAQALTGPDVALSDQEKLRLLQTLVAPQIENLRLGTPGYKALEGLGSTITAAPLRRKTARILEGARKAATKAVKPKQVSQAGRAKTLRTLLPTLGALRAQGADPIRGWGAIGGGASVADVNRMAEESAKTLAELAKARGPRLGKAALLAGGGAFLGSKFGAADATPKETQALIADLLLNQNRGPDRKKLVDAQVELAKARTAAIIHKILTANMAAQPATIPFT